MRRFPVILAVFLTAALAPLRAQALEFPGPVIDYYDIDGASRDLARQMRERSHTRSGAFFAETLWSVHYRFKTKSQAGRCAVTLVEVTLAATIRLPRLLSASADDAVMQKWAVFEPALHGHEMGHVEIAEAGAKEVETSLWDTPAQRGCSATGRLAKAAAQRLIADIETRQRDYDAQTGHGRTQGAWLP